jgi:hypothetical protein
VQDNDGGIDGLLTPLIEESGLSQAQHLRFTRENMPRISVYSAGRIFDPIL